MAVKKPLSTQHIKGSRQASMPSTLDEQNEINSFHKMVPDDPLSVVDNIWSTEYNETEEALARLEIKLMQKKRKIYEIQRVLQNSIDNINIILGVLHTEIEEI